MITFQMRPDPCARRRNHSMDLQHRPYRHHFLRSHIRRRKPLKHTSSLTNLHISQRRRPSLSINRQMLLRRSLSRRWCPISNRGAGRPRWERARWGSISSISRLMDPMSMPSFRRRLRHRRHRSPLTSRRHRRRILHRHRRLTLPRTRGCRRPHPSRAHGRASNLLCSNMSSPLRQLISRSRCRPRIGPILHPSSNLRPPRQRHSRRPSRSTSSLTGPRRPCLLHNLTGSDRWRRRWPE